MGVSFYQKLNVFLLKCLLIKIDIQCSFYIHFNKTIYITFKKSVNLGINKSLISTLISSQSDSEFLQVKWNARNFGILEIFLSLPPPPPPTKKKFFFFLTKSYRLSSMPITTSSSTVLLKVQKSCHLKFITYWPLKEL